MDGTFESGKRPPHDTCARKNVRHGLSYRNAKWVFYFLALLGFCNTWGRTVIDGSLGLLLKALDRRERYILPGTQERVRTCVTRLYWPFDYLLNILIIFFWEAVDGSHPSTSATGIYFLGQYFSILVSMHIDASRLGNARQWKLALVAWHLAFQMMAAAPLAPVYAIVYLSVSPLATELSLPRLAENSLAPSTPTWLLPLSLTVGYLAPGVVMALPSPSIVSNNFQQMAVVIWNIFPMLFLFLQQALGAIAATVGNQRTMRKPTPRQNLSAVRFAHTFALVVSTATHVAVLSVSLTTVMFPSMFQPGYARALSPGALLAPLATQTTVSSLGQGVQRFLFWDQVFAYSTLLFLGYVLLQRILPISGPIHSTSMIGFVAMGTLVVGPGSVTLALSWIKDEELLGRTEAYQDGTGKSGAVGINAATRRFSGVEGAEKVEHQIR